MSIRNLADTLTTLGLTPEETRDVILTTTQRQIAEAVSSVTGVNLETPARRTRSAVRRQKHRAEPYPVRKQHAKHVAPRSELQLPVGRRPEPLQLPSETAPSVLNDAELFNAALLAKVESSTAPPDDAWDGKPRLKDAKYRI